MGTYVEDDTSFWGELKWSNQNPAEGCPAGSLAALCLRGGLPRELKSGSLYVGSSRNRIILVTVGVAGGLLSVVSLAALVRCIGTQRKSGAQELTRHEPAAGAELQPVYSNEADSPRMHREGKEPIVIYSELKKRHPDDSAGQASGRGSIHGDDMQSYENVPCTSSAWGR
ncbi:Fc receptor-like protein 3 [Pteropus alecto]|uniref:Fc receptor-like protein 3 n=1 Tax=Pteropus alecto TaxID=9402 RepID=L5JTF3_PTEAL|nr:Fc receptor-like protein 3 [Pteropus alecto]